MTATTTAPPGTPSATASGPTSAAAEAPPAPRGRLRRARRALTVLFPVAVVTGIGFALYGRAGELAALVLRPDSVPYLLAALVANALAVLLSLTTWRTLLADLGPAVPGRTATRIYFTSYLGKYVPGAVWGVLAQLRMGGAAGVPAPVVLAVFLLNLVVAVLTGLAVGPIAAPWTIGAEAWWLVLPGAVTVAWAVRPALLHHLAAFAARIARRQAPTTRASDRGMRRALASATASWAVGGLHLWALAVMLGAPPLTALPVCVGGFALATAAASLVVVLPDGWGAREALLLLALTAVLPWQEATAVAVASRVVCTLSEVLVGGAALLLTVPRRSAPPAHPIPVKD
ncbi:lysylphosphatidylglycerol synthase domain-containing protein [Streptomyces flavochromogenes]|uniref:Lysylphosphatidylglycerol synthase domain-containing protein n=1 Tax=Streptomyces flavochromogenes TaxID=68199 RepID=A0ABW6XM05_9ACTN|nr:lysylphosphatidylglycerol synthase domain-containing protein [Streptomyces flavochromogenes]